MGMIIGVGKYGTGILVCFSFAFCLLWLPNMVEAQVTKKKKKKVSLFSDSVQFYRRVEEIAKKRKFTNELFRNIVSLPPPSKKYTGNVKKQNEDIYKSGENKIIRHIKIETLDPFGTDIADTSKKAISYFEKGGNIVHIKTRRFAIRNRLLFKEGDNFDKIEMYESERIIRSSDFVGDVSVRIDPDYISKDSVDIIIREQDRWSIYPFGAIGGNYKAGFIDKNIVGTGQQLEASLFKARLFDSTLVNYRFSYFVPYIKRTFITAGIIYNRERGNEYRGISINRGFYSPLARWAGGIDFFNYELIRQLASIDSSVIQIQNIRYWSQDLWAGFAFPIRGSSYQNRTTKFVVAGRVFNKNYITPLNLAFDPLLNQQNSTTYLMNFGITQRGFYKDKFIYKYGVTEDVPIGAMVSATLGYQKRPHDERYYMGLKSSYGVKLEGGNVSGYFEMGTYISTKGRYGQGTINAGIQGFTNLYKLKNNFQFRQFFSVDVTSGFNRTKFDRITINDVKGLKGFNPDSVVGSNKMVISTTAILYLPWQIIGFRFAPIFYGGFGMIGDEKVSFLKDNIFPVFGLGILVRNEYLIFNSFTFTLGFYPYIPNKGSAIFKPNPFGSNDFKFRNFEIGKPSEVGYF